MNLYGILCFWILRGEFPHWLSTKVRISMLPWKTLLWVASFLVLSHTEGKSHWYPMFMWSLYLTPYLGLPLGFVSFASYPRPLKLKFKFTRVQLLPVEWSQNQYSACLSQFLFHLIFFASEHSLLPFQISNTFKKMLKKCLYFFQQESFSCYRLKNSNLFYFVFKIGDLWK